jgi:hypothetical protein
MRLSDPMLKILGSGHGVIAAIILAASCTSSEGGAPSSSGTGPQGGTLCFSCINGHGALAAAMTPDCVNYYANAGSSQAAICGQFQAICTAGKGTLSTSPCTRTCAAGSCINTTAGAAAYGVYTELVFYSPVTSAQVQSSCASTQGATFVPVSGGATCPTGGLGADAGIEAAGDGSVKAGDTRAEAAGDATFDARDTLPVLDSGSDAGDAARATEKG